VSTPLILAPSCAPLNPRVGKRTIQHNSSRGVPIPKGAARKKKRSPFGASAPRPARKRSRSPHLSTGEEIEDEEEDAEEEEVADEEDEEAKEGPAKRRKIDAEPITAETLGMEKLKSCRAYKSTYGLPDPTMDVIWDDAIAHVAELAQVATRPSVDLSGPRLLSRQLGKILNPLLIALRRERCTQEDIDEVVAAAQTIMDVVSAINQS
jgi:hypothetical protein